MNSNISLKRIKSIIEKTDTINRQQDLNETTTANTCGLRILTCNGCHKSLFEDKFMLNKTNKRYRSCINCVMRARQTSENTKQKQPNTQHDLINNENTILAICDKEEQEEHDIYYNIEPNTNLTDYRNIEQKKEEDIIINNNTNYKPIHRTKQKIKYNNHEFPPPLSFESDINKGLFSLFNSE